MSVGVCCMDSLEQLVRRKTHIKGPVTLSDHFFFEAKSVQLGRVTGMPSICVIKGFL